MTSNSSKATESFSFDENLSPLANARATRMFESTLIHFCSFIAVVARNGRSLAAAELGLTESFPQNLN